ncbi:hypothetical protein BH09MYX1_BH09MYX1_40220 [soil metagenome]
MKKVAWFLVASSMGGLACSESGPRPANADEIPESVSISGGKKFTSGFSSDKVHRVESLDGYRIGKTLVSTTRYKQCVSVGACTRPALRGGACDRTASAITSGSTYDAAGDLPVTCVTPAQAEAYCAWVGGTLAGEAQWLNAARGGTPARFAWGAGNATCDQHPRATNCPRTEDSFLVGRHPLGASKSGIEDVLLVPGELVLHEKDSDACRGPSACVVQSTYPGEIVGVVPLEAAPKELKPWVNVYGFRCAWAGGAP